MRNGNLGGTRASGHFKLVYVQVILVLFGSGFDGDVDFFTGKFAQVETFEDIFRFCDLFFVLQDMGERTRVKAGCGG